MKLVWLSWKDIKHPLAGGAEKVTDNILSRLVNDGHEVVLLTSQPENMSPEETIHGYKVIRRGSRYSVYWHAYRYYKKHLADWADVTIEEINTVPFFSRFYAARTKRNLFIHQLAREVWFYEMVKPLSYIGYWLEPHYLRLLRKDPVITISASTRDDLVGTAGFDADMIHIIREGIELQPVADLKKISKFDQPTILALGSVRPMKRTLDSVLAFEEAKKQLPDLRLIIAGDTSDDYAKKVLSHIENSPYKDDISVLGSVSMQQKYDLMQRSHLQLVVSVKEGWGLTVTEANSQGTVVAAYDVDGLRDSVKDGQTGIVTPPSPLQLSQGIVSLLSDPKAYARMRQAAWEDSKQYTPENSYHDFLSYITAR